MQPTIDNPRYVQGKKGEGFTYYMEWRDEDNKRKRKTISDKEYMEHLKDLKPQTEMKAPAKSTKAKKVDPKPAKEPKVEKKTTERCPRNGHDFSEEADGWQVCANCGGRRKLRGEGPWGKGMARYTYRW